MGRITTAKVAAAAVVAVLIAGGAIKIYSYTSPLSDSSQSAPPCGYQDSTGHPFGCWAHDLGYLPQGYVPAPHDTNGPVYPCPPGMNASQCQQFKESCGNGICDPNETCGDCPIDCNSGTQLVCDQYTGRADEDPIGPPPVCQVRSNYAVG
jgi:hypothetical protein